MKTALVTAAILFALIVAGLSAYLIPFYTADPNFTVSVTKQTGGDYNFKIDPNFVVNSVYSVQITGPTGVLAKRDDTQSGVQ